MQHSRQAGTEHDLVESNQTSKNSKARTQKAETKGEWSPTPPYPKPTHVPSLSHSITPWRREREGEEEEREREERREEECQDRWGRYKEGRQRQGRQGGGMGRKREGRNKTCPPSNPESCPCLPHPVNFTNYLFLLIMGYKGMG